MSTKKLVLLGSCKKVHGIRGGFKFYYYNKDSDTLKKGSKVLVKNDAISKEFTVGKVAGQFNEIVSLVEVDNRNHAESLIPFDFYVERQDLPEIDEGEFYYADLEGLSVVDEQGEKVGEVIEVYDHGAQVIISVKGDKGVFDLAFVENFIEEVDLENKLIKVKMPEYLSE